MTSFCYDVIRTTPSPLYTHTHDKNSDDKNTNEVTKWTSIMISFFMDSIVHTQQGERGPGLNSWNSPFGFDKVHYIE